MWPIKLLFICFFIFILVSLFQALMMMQKNEPQFSMSKFIGRRLLFTVVLISLIFLAIAFGIITPNQRPY